MKLRLVVMNGMQMLEQDSYIVLQIWLQNRMEKSDSKQSSTEFMVRRYCSIESKSGLSRNY